MNLKVIWVSSEITLYLHKSSWAIKSTLKYLLSVQGCQFSWMSHKCASPLTPLSFPDLCATYREKQLAARAWISVEITEQGL